MGSRSKSRSSNTSGATSSTMGNLSKGKVSNEVVAGMQQDLLNKQMGAMLPIFAELVQNGQGMFGSNPMMNLMGSMFGQPMQVQTPDFLAEFIAKYNPPAPEQPQQTQPPQPSYMNGMGQTGVGAVPFNINEYMRNQKLGR